MKPSPSKKFRSGSSFSRRAGPSGNSCVTYQPSVSGEHKAQVTTKAEVEPGQRRVGVPVWRVLPPSLWARIFFCLGPLFPIPVHEKPSCYIFFPIFPPPHFLFFLIYWFSSSFFFPGVHLGRPDVLPQTPPLEKISEVSTIPDPYFSPVVGETLQALTTRLVPWSLSPCNLLISLFRSFENFHNFVGLFFLFPRFYCLSLFTILLHVHLPKSSSLVIWKSVSTSLCF